MIARLNSNFQFNCTSSKVINFRHFFSASSDLDMGGQFLRDLTLYGNANCHNILLGGEFGFLKLVVEFVGACLLCICFYKVHKSHLTFASLNTNFHFSRGPFKGYFIKEKTTFKLLAFIIILTNC